MKQSRSPHALTKNPLFRCLLKQNKGSCTADPGVLQPGKTAAHSVADFHRRVLLGQLLELAQRQCLTG